MEDEIEVICEQWSSRRARSRELDSIYGFVDLYEEDETMPVETEPEPAPQTVTVSSNGLLEVPSAIGRDCWWMWGLGLVPGVYAVHVLYARLGSGRAPAWWNELAGGARAMPLDMSAHTQVNVNPRKRFTEISFVSQLGDWIHARGVLLVRFERIKR